MLDAGQHWYAYCGGKGKVLTMAQAITLILSGNWATISAGTNAAWLRLSALAGAIFELRREK